MSLSFLYFPEDLGTQKGKNLDIIDVKVAIENFKTRKVPGIDDQPSELFKNG